MKTQTNLLTAMLFSLTISSPTWAVAISTNMQAQTGTTTNSQAQTGAGMASNGQNQGAPMKHGNKPSQSGTQMGNGAAMNGNMPTQAGAGMAGNMQHQSGIGMGAHGGMGRH